MSVTFTVKGERANWETGEGFVNLANGNAREVLLWLGYAVEDLWGELHAKELAARCRRRLWNEPRNHDPEKPGFEGRGAAAAFASSSSRAGPATCARRPKPSSSSPSGRATEPSPSGDGAARGLAVILRAEGIDEPLTRACREARMAIERRFRIGPQGRILEPGAFLGVPLYALYYLARAEEVLGEGAGEAKIAFEVRAYERDVFPELGDARRVELRVGRVVELWTTK
jgi:hypothetical protein